MKMRAVVRRKEADMLELLQNHWHCILPVAVLGIAMAVMQGREGIQRKRKRNSKKEIAGRSGKENYGKEFENNK